MCFDINRCTLLFTVCTLLALAGCDGSSSSGGDSSITSGTIGGLAFTVVDGTVTQETEDGPVSADSGEATILFDELLSVLSGTADLAIFEIDSTISAGGFVAALAFGREGDQFAGGLIGSVRRTGSTVEWGLFWGLTQSPQDGGPFMTPVANPGGPLRGIAAFDNSFTPAALSIWHPETADVAPFDSCFAETENTVGTGGGGAVDNGNGNRAGITFDAATISDVTISDQVSTGCF